MPRNIPTEHTVETLALYCQNLETQVMRLRACMRLMQENNVKTTQTLNDDSFHVGLKKVNAFTTAAEKGTSDAVLGSIKRPTVEESRTKSAEAEKQGRRLPKTRKTKG